MSLNSMSMRDGFLMFSLDGYGKWVSSILLCRVWR
jgi:hypothetical protein